VPARKPKPRPSYQSTAKSSSSGSRSAVSGSSPSSRHQVRVRRSSCSSPQWTPCAIPLSRCRPRVIRHEAIKARIGFRAGGEECQARGERVARTELGDGPALDLHAVALESPECLEGVPLDQTRREPRAGTRPVDAPVAHGRDAHRDVRGQFPRHVPDDRHGSQPRKRGGARYERCRLGGRGRGCGVRSHERPGSRAAAHTLGR
jgi:hypothetical protein